MLLQAVAAKLTSELGQRRRRPRGRQQRRQAQVAAGSMRLNSVARGSYPTRKISFCVMVNSRKMSVATRSDVWRGRQDHGQDHQPAELVCGSLRCWANAIRTGRMKSKSRSL